MVDIKLQYWKKYIGVLLAWFSYSFFGVLTLMVFIDFYRKHHMGKNDHSPFLNDGPDGDYGAEWWLIKYKLKPGTWSAIRWWLRNPCDNYLNSYPQPGTSDKSKVNVLYPAHLNDPNNIDEYADKMKWSNSGDKLYGWRVIYYETKGIVCGRISYANSWFTFQIGSGGDRFKCMLTPIWPLLLILFTFLWFILK